MLKTLKSNFKSRFRTLKIKSKSISPKTLKIKSKSASPRTKSAAATTLQSTFKNKSAKAEVCSICLDKLLYNKGQATLATCGHSFHKKCIIDYKNKGGRSCPLCRTKFDIDAIITPNEYKKLVYRKHNQPHNLNKTLRIYDEVASSCKQPYIDWLKARIQATNAWSNYTNHRDRPRWMHPTRYLWDKEEVRLLELKDKAEAIERGKYRIFKSKCKEADTFTLATDRNLSIPMPRINPNSYIEFNDYVQSIYETRNPNTRAQWN